MIANLSRALIAASAAAALLLAACSPTPGAAGDAAPAAVSPSTTGAYLGDVTMGKLDAPVKIVEYASTTCPHCRDFWKQEFARLKAAYIDTGKANYTLKDFPTPPVAVAVAGVAIARCAGKDKYYDVIDDLFTNQFDIMTASQNGDAVPELMKVALRHGLDANKAMACINDKSVTEFVAATVKASPNVHSTPTILINGKAVALHTFEGVGKAIDEALGAPAAATTAAAPAAASATTSTDAKP